MSDANQPPISLKTGSAASPALPLVGRELEMESIAGRLQQARDGKGSKLGVRGESGAGKTRLAQEVAASAKLIGMTILLIPCRGSLHRAHQPFADVVRELFGIKPTAPPHQQYARLEKALTDLGDEKLLEPLSGLLGVGPAGGQDVPEAPADNPFMSDETIAGVNIKLNPSDALMLLLGQIAQRERGLCLILDDLDEAHPRTIRAALELATNLARQPVASVLTFAPDPPHDILASFDLNNLITLTPLENPASDALVSSLLGVERVAADLLELVWRTARGDPLFTVLLVQELQLRGKIHLSSGGARLEQGGGPTTLMELIVDGASRLSNSEREALLCASVLGDGFRTGALGALRGNVRSDDLQTEFTTLEANGWLVRTGEGRLASFSFANRIHHQVMYNSIPDERLKTLHNHAGDYYSVAIGGRKVRAENAAYHYIKSGNAKRALPVIESAAQKALAAGDREAAMNLYRLGSEAALMDPSLAAKQIEMAEHLGDMYLANWDYDMAVQVYTENSPTMTSPSLFSKLGLALLAVDPARAANILSRALAILQIGEKEDMRWMLEASLSWAMALSGNSYEAIRRSRDALGKLGDTVGFGWARSMMRGMLGMVLFYDGEVQEALPHLESAKAGWGARGQQEGVALVNQVLITMPQQDVTRAWLKMILPVILKP